MYRYTIQYNTIQYNTIQYNTIQYNILYCLIIGPTWGIIKNTNIHDWYYQHILWNFKTYRRFELKIIKSNQYTIFLPENIIPLTFRNSWNLTRTAENVTWKIYFYGFNLKNSFLYEHKWTEYLVRVNYHE
jgi:hypothetical protein